MSRFIGVLVVASMALGVLGSCSSGDDTGTVATTTTIGGARVDQGFVTTAGVGPESLVVIGDSITNEGRDQLLEVFADRYRVVLDGRPGHVVAELQDAADDLASPVPSVAIIELGTNDVTSGRDLARSALDLRRMVAALGEVPCLVLVTVDEGLPRQATRARTINAAIRSIAASDPQRIRIVDVGAVIDAAEADPTFRGPFHYDGVHPSVEGQTRLAAAYAEIVASCRP